ncbi:unnamed protein product [Mesocestoides corti]|uniref:Pecanex-like protein n=1 Tax=Mesocestoides corti TaxID=53468 RepID=A0A0R3UE19_MESCO|nr:unnamed protein product [Mesocestoides corti]
MMVTQHRAFSAIQTTGSFTLKRPGSLQSSSSGSHSDTSKSITSSDSGEQTLNSDCSIVSSIQGGRPHQGFLNSDDDEEDWSISEKPGVVTSVTNFSSYEQNDEQPQLTAYRLITALDIWIRDVRVHTEPEAFDALINKPLLKSSSCKYC